MKRTLALILALAMMLGLLLSGCGSSGTTETQAAAEGTTGVQDVTLKVWVPEEEKEITQQMADSFAAAHPEYNFSVELAIMGIDEANAQLKTDADSAADVFQLASGGVPELQKMGLLLPIGYDEANLRQLYAENAITAVTAEDGLIYAVPFTPNTFFMYYDNTLLDESDVATLEGIMAKETADNVYNFYFESAGGWKLGCYYYGAGLSIFGPNGDDQAAGCDWNSETGIAVTEYLIDLINNPKCAYDGEISVSELIAEHRLGAWFDGSWNYDLYKDILGDDLGLAVIPTFNFDGTDRQLLGFYGSKCIGVNAHSQNTAAAVAFATYLGNEENQLLRYELSAQIPAHEAAGNSETVQADPLAAVIVEEANTASIMQPVATVFSAKYWNYANTIPTEIRSGVLNKDNVQEKMDAFVAAMETE